MSLEEYDALHGRPSGTTCRTCALFRKKPDLAAEVRAARARHVPIVFRVIHEYLRDDHGVEISGASLLRHFTDHEKR